MAKDKIRRPRAETPKGFRDYFGAEVTARAAMLFTMSRMASRSLVPSTSGGTSLGVQLDKPPASERRSYCLREMPRNSRASDLVTKRFRLRQISSTAS